VNTPVIIIHGIKDEAISYYGASIIAYQGEITNPNVIYKTCSAENHNGHNIEAGYYQGVDKY
jgi:hypothetical protein